MTSSLCSSIRQASVMLSLENEQGEQFDAHEKIENLFLYRSLGAIAVYIPPSKSSLSFRTFLTDF